MADIALNTEFQQRVFAKIRDSIGDLMSEDDLRKLLDTTIEKAFFEKRKVLSPNSYSSSYQEIESVFIEETRKLLDKQVRDLVRAYIDENHERIEEGIKVELAKMWPAIVIAMVKSVIDSNSYTLVNTLREQGILR